MTSGAKRLVGAKRPGGKRPGGKRLGGETTRGGNGLGAKRPGFYQRTKLSHIIYKASSGMEGERMHVVFGLIGLELWHI